jgi:hypothetical protein
LFDKKKRVVGKGWMMGCVNAGGGGKSRVPVKSRIGFLALKFDCTVLVIERKGMVSRKFY